MAEFEWSITVRRWDVYGEKVIANTPATVIAATRTEVTQKVRAAFEAAHDDFRKFWSHDWTVQSVREIPATEQSNEQGDA